MKRKLDWIKDSKKKRIRMKQKLGVLETKRFSLVSIRAAQVCPRLHIYPLNCRVFSVTKAKKKAQTLPHL